MHDSLIFFKDDYFLIHAWENESIELVVKNVVFGGKTSNFPEASIFRLSLPTTASLRWTHLGEFKKRKNYLIT